MDHFENALTSIMTQVTKYTTMTGCNKEPTELCAPVGCGFTEVSYFFSNIVVVQHVVIIRGRRSVTTL